jgi:flagellar assembly factor FliW
MASVIIESTRFGTVEIDSSIILDFPSGMIGFSEQQRFAILKQREDSVFMWLHSIDDPALAFPIVLPWVFYWDYEVDLADADMEAIGVTRADQISIYCVVNVGADVRNASVNLFSPVVINNAERRARQVINTIAGYTTRDRLFRDTDSPTPVAMHESDAPNVTVLSAGR